MKNQLLRRLALGPKLKPSSLGECSASLVVSGHALELPGLGHEGFFGLEGADWRELGLIGVE